MSRNTLYDIKPKFVVALDGITSSLARRGVNPNAVTLLAIPVAVATGASLALGAVWAPAWFVVAPLCLFLMGINAVDGSLARATGQETRRGAVLNELVDRFGDVAILGSAFALVAATDSSSNSARSTARHGLPCPSANSRVNSVPPETSPR